MCGICGIYSYDKNGEKILESELINIRDYMTKRGPDDKGIWINDCEHIGLAHRRLTVLDLSESGKQPMVSINNRYIIVFNGEIYNYKELRKDLDLSGYKFFSNTDTEVILNLFDKYGILMLDKLRGMFSFAIWDKNNNSLFLARDQFGIKPLYYYEYNKIFKFASQVKALLAGNCIVHDDPAGHVGFFLWGSIPEPYTLYREIKSLPAGSYMIVTCDGISKINKYYELEKQFSKNENNTKHNYLEKQELLYSSLLDSIKHHVISDVPVGMFLSAGKDSCSLVSLANQTNYDRLKTITLGFNEFKGTENDETTIAERFARNFNTEHKTIWVSKRNFQDELDNFMNAMDQPSIDGINTYFVSKHAADTGLKVTLSGLGGDEIFLGYNLFYQIPKIVKCLTFIKAFPQICKNFTLITKPLFKKYANPKYSGILEYGSDINGAYLLKRGLYMPWELTEFLDKDLVKEGWDKLKYSECLEIIHGNINDLERKLQVLELSLYMRNQLLRDADWAGMAHSLEIRVPFIDVKLIETVIELSGDGFSPNKQDMINCLHSKLPDYIISKNKTGFNTPIKNWLLDICNKNEKSEYGLRTWSKEVYNYQTNK